MKSSLLWGAEAKSIKIRPYVLNSVEESEKEKQGISYYSFKQSSSF